MTRHPHPTTPAGLALLDGTPSGTLLDAEVPVVKHYRRDEHHHPECYEVHWSDGEPPRRRLATLVEFLDFHECCQGLLDAGTGLLDGIEFVRSVCDEPRTLPDTVELERAVVKKIMAQTPDLRVFEPLLEANWEASDAFHRSMSDADALEVLDLEVSQRTFTGKRYPRLTRDNVSYLTARLPVREFTADSISSVGAKIMTGSEVGALLNLHATRVRPEGHALVLSEHPLVDQDNLTTLHLQHAVHRFTLGDPCIAALPRSVVALLELVVVIEIGSSTPTPPELARGKRILETYVALQETASNPAQAMAMAHVLESQ